MTVLMTRNPKGKSRKFSNQAWFEDFIWDRCEVGDIVWLEDYEGTKSEGKMVVGIIARFDSNDPVVRVLPQRAAQILVRIDNIQLDPLTSIVGVNNYLQGFMYK